MAEKRLVIGSGPDALRAAAVLATGGYQVTLLQEGPTPSGMQHPRYPAGTGWMRVSDAAREQVEAVLGPVVEAPDPHRAVTRGGRRFRLPLSPHQVPRLLDAPVLMPAAWHWLRARLKGASNELLGGGQEERSYRDWIARRMGGPAYHHLYRSYAHRRWAHDPDDLSASLAQVHHGLPDPGPFQVAGGGYDEVLRTAERVIIEAGGEIITQAQVRGLVALGGRVVAVRCTDGELPVSGPLWVALDPVRVCALLGEACQESLRVDAGHLPVQDAAIVVLRGEVDGLPDELHVLDEDAPFWRVVVPYGVEKTALMHITAPQGSDGELIARCEAAALALGIGRFTPTGEVERLQRWVPVWTCSSHARFRRTLRAWRQLGIVGVGRSGMLSPMDPGTEIAMAGLYRDLADPDQAEIHRVHLDPPVRRDDLDARITRLIER